MALLIFISSSGISMDIHLCQGKVKRMNLFGKALSCAEVSSSSSCHKSADTTSSCATNGVHDGCCNNKTLEFDLDFDAAEMFAVAHAELDVDLDLSLSLFNQHTSIGDVASMEQRDFYVPPLLQRDISVLYQAFLL